MSFRERKLAVESFLDVYGNKEDFKKMKELERLVNTPFEEWSMEHCEEYQSKALVSEAYFKLSSKIHFNAIALYVQQREHDSKTPLYYAMTEMFRSLMQHELEANIEKKGFGRMWLAMTKRELLYEIYYHVGKLQGAMIPSIDIEKIKEHAADTGCMLMMLLDKLLYSEESDSELIQKHF